MTRQDYPATMRALNAAAYDALRRAPDDATRAALIRLARLTDDLVDAIPYEKDAVK